MNDAATKESDFSEEDKASESKESLLAMDAMDEAECRVCRGPEEEDRPLYKPCKCSGSIGWTHQDCLQSWLAVNNNSSRCELCGVTFRFTNRYAPNTPERLSVMEVLLGVGRNILATWVPFCLRIAVAAALWLLIAPLFTAFIYHGWMHGNMFLTTTTVFWKLRWNVLADELVSGAVLVAFILFSFLSLMSFVDFLRAEFNDPRPPRDAVDRIRPAAAAAVNFHFNAVHQDNIHNFADIDIGIWEQYYKTHSLTNSSETTATTDPPSQMPQHTLQPQINNDPIPGYIIPPPVQQHNLPINHVDNIIQQNHTHGIEARDSDSDADDIDQDHPLRDDDDDDVNIDNLENEHVPEENNPPNIAQAAALPNNNNNNNNNVPNDLMDDDPVLDADLNIALDELLGVRGPLWIVMRNLLWLLAFNTLYLALFAFLPRVVGSLVVFVFTVSNNATTTTTAITAVNNTMNQTTALVENILNNITDNNTLLTVADAPQELTNITNTTFSVQPITKITDYSVLGIFRAVERESDRLDTTFRLKDLALVTVGYTCAAIMIVILRYLWVWARYKTNNNNNNPREDDENEQLRDTLLELNRVVQGNGLEFDEPLQRFGQGLHPPPNPNFDEDGNIAVGYAVDVVLDAAVSIVKVAVLLFLKMFLLPVMLGFFLDLSTLALFQRTVDDMILYAGKDLFSFLFLHWVAGISFMLLVTVSVLQLREVAHPNVLAHIIRPQEPQPDLLGNLLHDPLVTHGKRLILSLVIYILLLLLQVHIPVHLCVSFLGSATSEYWKLKLCYILTPRLQIPIELCIFHLCMLAFLEKNKNSIGEMQHAWLKFICGLMDIGNAMLPHEVEKFEKIGTHPVFLMREEEAPVLEGQDIDPLWCELANESNAFARQKIIEEKLISLWNSKDTSLPEHTVGATLPNGNRVIRIRSEYIKLPAPVEGGFIILPTKAGRYRLNRGQVTISDQRIIWVMELWEEVPGAPIPRPPEGWDDLGAGGADVQGRWAWDREKKSVIEEGVAQRSILYTPGMRWWGRCKVTGKLCCLVFLSWVAGTIASCVLLASPLVTGRLLFSLLRLPDHYVHDPFCFAVGSSVVFPLLRRLMSFFKTSDQSFLGRCKRWLRKARLPPLRKFFILVSTGIFWFGFMPGLIGLAYDALFLWSNDRFVSQGLKWEPREVVLSWVMGNALLSGWSACCVVGLLTREFWAGVFFNDVNRAEAGRDPSSWQGSNGKVARFWGVWKDVILGWEWDKVDVVVLLDECVLPLLRTLLWVLIVPALLTIVVATWLAHQASYSIPLVARISTAFFTFLYMGLSCEEQVSRWFDVAHRTARDDRYLIGQLLMNHRD